MLISCWHVIHRCLLQEGVLLAHKKGAVKDLSMCVMLASVTAAFEVA